MKTILRFLTVLTGLVCTLAVNAQTTVANGNWSNPATWGGTPPVGSGTVIINHTVTLDVDYGHISGSVTINASGALNGSSPMRAFSLNYPTGTATLTVNGSFNVARVPLISGTVNNNGMFQSDSLFNSSTLTISNGATINALQFLNYTGGTINNDGAITSVNFLNIETVTNNGTITSNDFCNSKSFTNSSTGVITATNDFSNIDTLASPAIFTNNGTVTVQSDWHNGNQIKGSGKFCVSNNTWNSASMSGTFDFCDLTGGNVDLNTGTIAGTITYCLFSCSAGIDEYTDNSVISIFPNPVKTSATIKTNFDLNNSTLTVYNLVGQEIIKSTQLNGRQFEINCKQLNSGLYFFTIKGQKHTVTAKLIVD
ncbi:MAG: T9SS type A sorting domain-containing protein [Bacteroidales bacterium]|nr:T9SS type A sorting domain-containing protein [Bacteroidales bacterium]